MKQLNALLLYTFLALAMVNCSDDEPFDPCADAVCLNGGVCADGFCDCPDGYSGSQCQTYDACYDVTCLNGGTCVNGLCDCPDGYSGLACGTAITPVSMTVSQIVVTRFSATTPTGGGWDVNSGPDIYPTLSMGSQSLYISSTHYPDANPALNYSWTIAPPVVISSPTAQHTIRLYDYDTVGSDDFMGGINFTPYAEIRGFATEIDLDAGGTVAFTIYVEYQW